MTRDELDQVRQIIRASPATASQVGLVNLAVKGTGILLVGLAWILLMVVLRRIFNFWFDADIYNDKYLSTAVVIVLLYCTMRILVAVVS